MKRENRAEESRKDVEESLIGALLHQPARNLECRIRELEQDISERRHLNEQALSVVAARKQVLEDRLHRLRYVSMFSETFIVNREFLRQMLQLEENAIREMSGCFSDISRLKQRLQMAKEELALERRKLRLVESG
jgi:hypothetical protein